MVERGGWNVPGPLNLDEEEDDLDQDDLLVRANSGDPDNMELAKKPSEAQLAGQVLRKRYFYQMNFEIEFPHSDDTVYLAYSRPYSYSQIIAHMFEIEKRLMSYPKSKRGSAPNSPRGKEKPFYKKISGKAFTYERSLLCTSISGLPVPKISITAKKSYLNNQTSFQKRKVLFITARVHPGETNASTVFEGFFEALVQHPEYQPLLANYIVKLVPCMNPDGVVCGNYRSSLAGVDLNR